MSDYFNPTRRKLGLLTLLLACVFAAGWVRGLCVRDFYDSGRLIPSSRGIVIDSNGYSVMLSAREGATIWLAPDGEINTVDVVSDARVALNRIIVVPYRSVVPPLTLLSAYLLFSKPRTSQPKPASEA